MFDGVLSCNAPWRGPTWEAFDNFVRTQEGAYNFHNPDRCLIGRFIATFRGRYYHAARGPDGAWTYMVPGPDGVERTWVAPIALRLIAASQGGNFTAARIAMDALNRPAPWVDVTLAAGYMEAWNASAHIPIPKKAAPPKSPVRVWFDDFVMDFIPPDFDPPCTGEPAVKHQKVLEVA